MRNEFIFVANLMVQCEKIELIMKILSSHRSKLGIDIGSYKTRIWSSNDGLVVDEPTLIAVEEKTKKIITVGQQALEMMGRVGAGITVYAPFQRGRIYDFDLARAMLKVYLQRVYKASYFFSPIIMVSYSIGITKVAKESISDLIYSLGAKQVFHIAQPLVAAIGAGIPIADASGSVIFQLGAGLAEAAIISLGSVVLSKSSYSAGFYADKLVVEVMRKKYGIIISSKQAEKIRIKIGSLLESDKTTLVTGKDLIDQSPKEILISSKDILPVMNNLAKEYEQLLKDLLSKVPAELTADLLDKGMLLSGGMAQIEGLDDYFTETLGIPVTVVDRADTAVINGIATALDHLELFKESFGYKSNV